MVDALLVINTMQVIVFIVALLVFALILISVRKGLVHWRHVIFVLMWLTHLLIFYTVEAIFNRGEPNVFFTMWSVLLRLSGLLAIGGEYLAIISTSTAMRGKQLSPDDSGESNDNRDD